MSSAELEYKKALIPKLTDKDIELLNADNIRATNSMTGKIDMHKSYTIKQAINLGYNEVNKEISPELNQAIQDTLEKDIDKMLYGDYNIPNNINNLNSGFANNTPSKYGDLSDRLKRTTSSVFGSSEYLQELLGDNPITNTPKNMDTNLNSGFPSSNVNLNDMNLSGQNFGNLSNQNFSNPGLSNLDLTSLDLPNMD
jgi:hypothetical protein